MRIHTIGWQRQWALDLLREKHRLSLFEVYGDAPEKVQIRQGNYEKDLKGLKEKWAKEDEEIKKELACENS